MRFLRHKRLRLAVLAGVGLLVLGGVLLERATRIDPARLRPGRAFLVVDRHGDPLRFIPDAQGRRHLWAKYEEIPDRVRSAFLAAEDSRFFSHPGVDPAALVRALWDNLWAGRIVSGASTLTQQLCRMAYPRPRTLYHKALEAVRALRLESRLSKEEILTLYLNRVPLGNNVLGVRAGARLYFGLELKDLTSAQAALLACLPKSPGRLNPYGPNRARLAERWRWVLARMAEQDLVPADPLASGVPEFPTLEPRSFPFEAAHLVDLLQGEGRLAQAGPVIKTSIDLDLQRTVEGIVRSHRTRLNHRGADQAAAVVLANQGPQVLALAGSHEYGPRDRGFNNGAAALRSPGSVLKPFLYAFALDQGLTAATTLEDLKRRFRTPEGDYLPANFDRQVYGPVSIRTALGNSLNLSAINLLNQVGYRPFYQTLRSLDLINHPQLGPDHYGLGLVVGNPEVSLLQIAAAYACLANGGVFAPARLLAGTEPAPGERIFSPQAAYIIAHILSDPGARGLTFGRSRAMNPPYALALKTGTSTNYRDCWVVGFTPRHTVAVWVGNFDGRPTWGLSGATAAAPILRDIMDLLQKEADPGLFPRPQGIVAAPVCTHSGLKPNPNCEQVREELFIAGTEPRTECTFHTESGHFHSLPAEYAGWVHTRHQGGYAGRYRLQGYGQDLDRVFDPSSASAPARNNPGLGAALQARPSISILQPLEGDRFVWDGEEMKISFRASLSSPVREILWFVDGRQEAATGPPFQMVWPARQGPHRITALAPDGAAASVSIVVE